MSRLRWQLTVSHLIAIAFTLVCMIAAVLLIASAWWTRTSNASVQPADDARLVTASIQNVARRELDHPTGELSSILGLLASGDLQLPSGLPSSAPGEARFHAPVGSSLTDVAYLVVVRPDGSVLGSSDPSGAAFSPAERAEWTPLIDSALGGTNDSASLSDSNPVPLGAYPILGPNGTSVAVTLVARTAVPPATSWWDFWGTLLFFGAAIIVVLAGASVFALASSSLVSYLLARRLVRRLEQLGRAAEGFAAGDLTRRVDAERNTDEVGQLGHRFNLMADRLSDTLAELAFEKQTVEEALVAKRELVANVSHELRTPLASIRGHVESLLLRGADVRDGGRSYLEVIHRQAEQLSRLIDDLFLLSTTEAGALSLAIRPVMLRSVIEEVISSIQPAARSERQVSLVSSVDPGLPPVQADRQRVAQVLANLVRNAVRYTPEGGLVAVRASVSVRDERFAVVTVEDTGEGILADELEHIFERFYRADQSRDRASGGTGLGLAIVRELVTSMGGEVFAESSVGEGSRFSFSLPVEGASLGLGARNLLSEGQRGLAAPFEIPTKC
jgi:signal transduction histidine kinase